MSLARDEYDNYWRTHPYPSRGPVNWRGRYHCDPDPEYSALCEAADRQGGRVELSLQGGQPRVRDANDRPCGEYRLLNRLSVVKAGEPLVIVDVQREGGMSAAARAARNRLGELEAA